MGPDEGDGVLAPACARARRVASDALDDDLSGAERAALDEHLRTCPACRRFATDLERVRSRLRVEAVGEVPPIADRVLEHLGGSDRAPASPARRPLLVAAAATFLIAGVVGALVAGLTAPPPAVADIPAQILAAQGGVDALSARTEITEHGWHPEVPTRTYEGTLTYHAPERLVLDLVDRTDYPTDAWVANNVVHVIDDDVTWSSGPAPCPTAALPSCTPRTPRRTVTTGRAPFAGGGAPLDAIVPVASFVGAAPPRELGARTVDGQPAVGVAVTVAQARPVLEAFTGTGSWRELYATDHAEIWLHEDRLVPLEIVVRADASGDRARWAAARGYDDEAGATLLTIRLRDVGFDGAALTPDPPPPPDVEPRDGAFTAAAPTGLSMAEPTALPDGMAPHRSGIVDAASGPRIEVRSWSDGRGWLRVRSTHDWEGGRLFGDLGSAVRRVDLGADAGVAYIGEGGQRLALHTPRVDVVIDGTLPTDDLLAVAASLGLEGVPVPDSWAEASTATVADAGATLPHLLVPPQLEGFDEPGVSIVGADVALTYHGPGARAFVLTQSPGETLTPPLAADVRGVELRGTVARYTPARGELEWVEDGVVVSIRSRTLGLGELVAIAERLRPAVDTASDVGGAVP